MAFNYYDELRTGNAQGWISYLNRHYINLVAPEVQIFKLNKEETELDELYGEAKNARLYLPPFTIRAFYLDNLYQQMVGYETMPYMETEEETMQFVLNFDEMVEKIRELKNRKISSIYIDYSGDGEPTALKDGNTFIIKENDSVVAEWDLTDVQYGTTKKLTNEIDQLSSFSAALEGKNDTSTDLVSFNETRFKHSRLLVYSPDTTFANITEVVEKGDVVLSNKWKLYEVASNIPGGNFGWDYATFVLTCNLRTLDEVQLPGDYNTQIEKHQHGLEHRVDME
jgi:hypothetical protein